MPRLLPRTTRSISWLASFALLTLVLVACDDAEPVAPADARAELIDRNWIDVWPQNADDELHVYRFTPSMGGGVYQDRTVFEGRFELFTFEATGDTIRFRFPGKDETHSTAYRIERVDGPAPFTRRLTLEDTPRGPAVYYGWDEGSGASPFAQVRGAPRPGR
ncbi:MAG TPA: hypothetical protein RMH85_22450 [Polyangiaceae bacterium LLY-WYZ-15_(1-7)]|nr:hypothetical protein [Myxococcales bacterium]MBJ72045.1 hypothetical protein [Sandaracinus sp.]HJL02582.1 hypothetical protein [Polyangiaceae bacterium LLY-WYZ-15_(1-7)]HJL11252.1 hypothetical protein [Polyangiaceae bacterium LLY-WYZ-15_(1-7)]HJL22793.1 hypothetical protein [Polyangiaceae bacterium LLY-WYZ-15_(1-7)]